MQDILMRAECFIGIIILGYTLRSIGVFKEEDFRVLSTIVVKITLPAAIVSSFNGKEIDPAMLMIGVGFKLSGDRSQPGAILKILIIRYSVATVIGLSCFFLLPFALEVRQALLILAFSPIASAAPAFTVEMDGDVGLSSAVNSISIVVSIVIIVGILMVTV